MATDIGSSAIPTNRPIIAILHLPHFIHSLHNHGKEVYLKQTDTIIIVCNYYCLFLFEIQMEPSFIVLET